MKIPILEEYTKINNIEYDFLLTAEYIGSIFNPNVKIERAFLSMVDSNNNTLQFEEIDRSYINDGILCGADIMPIVTRFIREQRLKELGI